MGIRLFNDAELRLHAYSRSADPLILEVAIRRGKRIDIETIRVTTTADRIRTTEVLEISPGEIIGCLLIGGRGDLREFAFAEVEPRNKGSANASILLCQGRPSTIPLGLGTYERPLENPGEIRSVNLGNPSAGADYATQTVPTNALWKPVGFEGDLVADANAANRSLTIDYTDGTDVVGGVVTGLTHTASRTHAYRGNRGGGGPMVATNVSPSIDTTVAFPMGEFLLPEVYEVTFVTLNLLAGDNWGDGQLLVEEWVMV